MTFFYPSPILFIFHVKYFFFSIRCILADLTAHNKPFETNKEIIKWNIVQILDFCCVHDVPFCIFCAFYYVATVGLVNISCEYFDKMLNDVLG